ncbi:MAG TPA: hypothetical protein VF183_07000 [Acidimicrobiales bacterium]
MALAALLDVHRNVAWVVVISNGLAGVWALGAHRYLWLRTRLLWWFTVLAQISVFAQVALGVTVQQAEDIEAPELHELYGFVAIVAVGIIYAYRHQLEEHRYLLYGLGGLFLMGLGIRSMFLA